MLHDVTLNHHYVINHNSYIFLQCGHPPSDVSWFISPSIYSYLRTINHSDIGAMFTNLAIVWGPHIVNMFKWSFIAEKIMAY